MKAVFISDAHLDGSACEGYRYVMRFLDFLKGSADEFFYCRRLFRLLVFRTKTSVYPGFYDIVEKLAGNKKVQGQTSRFLRAITIFFLMTILQNMT